MFRMDTQQIATQRAMAAEIGARLGRQHKPVTWLQREAGIPASTWRKYFVPGAITRDVPLSVVQRIAKALGMSAGQLITLAEETAPDFYAESMKGLNRAERDELAEAIQRSREDIAQKPQNRRTGP